MSTSLKGLNLLYPPTTTTTTTTPSDELFSDISAQLDIWTNLKFASDEPLVESHIKDTPTGDLSKEPSPLDEPSMPPPSLPTTSHPSSTTTSSPLQSFDFNHFLAGFGIDPFLAPLQPLSEADMSSLSPGAPQASPSSPFSPISSETPGAPPSEASAAKRTRMKRAEDDPLTTPLSVTEDKRRRNTAASARFRAKKKEREQAMEKRSKELENRVSELERECEGLRRENGWLKGLVVGVTSGNSTNISPSTSADIPSTLETATEQPETNKKRKRGVGTD